MDDNIQTNTVGRLMPCLQKKIDKTTYLVEVHFLKDIYKESLSHMKECGRLFWEYTTKVAHRLYGEQGDFSCPISNERQHVTDKHASLPAGFPLY